MTDLADILSDEAIFPQLQEDGHKQILCRLAESLSGVTGLDKREVFSGIMARERLGSTAIGDGVAIPHASPAGLAQPVGAFASLVTPADFDANDGQGCDLVFMLLAPIGSGSVHLRALAKVSRLLGQGAVRQQLRAATSREQILAVLASGTRAAA